MGLGGGGWGEGFGGDVSHLLHKISRRLSRLLQRRVRHVKLAPTKIQPLIDQRLIVVGSGAVEVGVRGEGGNVTEDCGGLADCCGGGGERGRGTSQVYALSGGGEGVAIGAGFSFEGEGDVSEGGLDFEDGTAFGLGFYVVQGVGGGFCC